MSKFSEKFSHAAHIKKNTAGTSNEISLSVLDAKKNQVEGAGSGKPEHPHFGAIRLFTLPWGRKKPASTPKKDKEIVLSGDSAAVDSAQTAGNMSSGTFAPDIALASQAETPTRPKKQPLLPSRGTEAAEPEKKVRSFHLARKEKAAKEQKPPQEKERRTPEEEIADRKLRRKRRRRLALAGSIVLVLCVIGAAGTYFYADYTQHQIQVGQLDQAIDKVMQADEIIHQLDAAVQDPFGEDAQVRDASIKPQLKDATALLYEALGQAQTAASELSEAKSKDVANQTAAAIRARNDMVRNGSELLSEAALSRDELSRFQVIWQQILNGDALVRQAAYVVTETSDDAITKSKEITLQAQSLLQTASEQLKEFQAAYPDTDYAPYQAYVDKRVESLGYALASDEAYLVQDTAAAVEQNNAYNKADAEATALAKKLPSDPLSPISEAFDRQAADLQSSYSTARLQASTADAFIRDYLG